MSDQEAAAYTRGHAVGMQELKAAEKEWQAERAGLIAQRNYREIEARLALAEIQRLRWRWYREPFLMVIAIGIGWTVAILLGVVK